MLRKICPRCYYRNDEFATVCLGKDERGDVCGESLFQVEATEETSHNAARQSEDSCESARVKGEPVSAYSSSCMTTVRAPSNPMLCCETSQDFAAEIWDGATIGREGDIDTSPLQKSEFISRIHASFLHSGGDWFIRDENSMNGTRVNLQKVEPFQQRLLKDGDRITLGNITFTFKKI